MRDWLSEAKSVTGLDPAWKEKARKRLREQTRPEGSLGLLESLIERLAGIQKKDRLSTHPKRILIFAADHGVAEEGVSLYPREVTKAMVLNFLNGGATINALARQINADVKVIDVGVDADFPLFSSFSPTSILPHKMGEEKGGGKRGFGEGQLIHAKIARGTRNMACEAAMSAEELDQAMNVGWEMVHEAKKDGIKILGLGEMGIGNTTAASAVNAALTEQPVEVMTGRGTGLGEAMLEHKIEVIKRAHALHAQFFPAPLQVLRCVGGFEIAALTGAIIAGAKLEMPLVVDGWIVTAAALAAVRLNPKILDYLFFAHQSEERGHQLVLEILEVQPLLDLSMRLGEASGAALAMGILEAGVHIYNEVATFAEAGVATRKDKIKIESEPKSE